MSSFRLALHFSIQIFCWLILHFSMVNKEKPSPTKRLTFRDWELDDVDAFHAICSDPRVMEHVGDSQTWSREQAQQFIQRAIALSETTGFCQWPLIFRESSLLIGFCGFVNSDEGAEIGWRLAPDYWGQGLATEAARAVVRHGFETLGFQRIIATVQTENRASIRVVEKLGMTLERSFQRNGREVLVFSMENRRVMIFSQV